MMNVIKSENTKTFFAILAFVIVMAAFNTFASAAPVDWTSAVESDVKATAADVTKVMLAILTVALGIFGLQWGVRKAIRFFKATTN